MGFFFFFALVLMVGKALTVGVVLILLLEAGRAIARPVIRATVSVLTVILGLGSLKWRKSNDGYYEWLMSLLD